MNDDLNSFAEELEDEFELGSALKDVAKFSTEAKIARNHVKELSNQVVALERQVSILSTLKAGKANPPCAKKAAKAKAERKRKKKHRRKQK